MLSWRWELPGQDAVDDWVDFDRPSGKVEVAHGHGHLRPALLHLDMQALVQQRCQVPAGSAATNSLGKLLQYKSRSWAH
jgi:hypothetical protein